MPLLNWCIALLIASAPLGTDTQQKPVVEDPAGQQAKPKPSVAMDPAELPVDIDRIQRALERTPMLRFDADLRPVIRVQVFGDKPTIDDILGPDWAKGPVPHGAMTHQEFLALVTPKDIQGYAGFSNEQAATVAATSFLFQWTLQKAIEKYRASRDERERAAARAEVLEALQALEDARAKAGMTPR